MGFTEAISSGFSKYVTFSGRAARSEYWYWTLFATIVAIVAVVIDVVVFPDMDIRPVNTIVSLALFLPGLAVDTPPARHRPDRVVVPDRIHGHRLDRAPGVFLYEGHGRTQPLRPGSAGGATLITPAAAAGSPRRGS
jgi:hypothetical protein